MRKKNATDLLSAQPETTQNQVTFKDSFLSWKSLVKYIDIAHWLYKYLFELFLQDEPKPTAVAQEKKVKEKKEHLSKAQKRKMADRVDLKGRVVIFWCRTW